MPSKTGNTEVLEIYVNTKNPQEFQKVSVVRDRLGRMSRQKNDK